MQNHDEIIVFQRFSNAIDANIAKSKLDAYGIPCFLTEENIANLYPGAGSLMNFSVRLHLFGLDADRATQIMAENNLRVEDDSFIKCPCCGSHNIERDFPKKLTLDFVDSLRYLFFGIFYPEKKVYRCSDCDAEF